MLPSPEVGVPRREVLPAASLSLSPETDALDKDTRRNRRSLAETE